MKKLAQMNPNAETDRDAEEIVVINPHIWKKSGLSRLDFLKRIKRVKALRVQEITASQEATYLPVLSYFPRSLESWELLERFHNLVNEGDFSVFDGRTPDSAMAVMLAPRLSRWLLNTKVVTMQNQILNWVAAWTTYHETFPDKKIIKLPAGIAEKVESIKREHYGDYFASNEIGNPTTLKQPREFFSHYEHVAKLLTGSAPPEILKLRNREVDKVYLKAWGLRKWPLENWVALDFSYRYAYISDDIWNAFVMHERTEELDWDWEENCEELRQKWLHTFELFPTRKSHLFSILGFRDNELANASTSRTPQISESLRNEVLQYHGYTCIFEGRSRPEFTMHVHHVISKNLIKRMALPERLFTARENLVCACSGCNIVKSADLTQADVRFYLVQFTNPNHPNHPLIKFLERIQELQQES